MIKDLYKLGHYIVLNLAKTNKEVLFEFDCFIIKKGKYILQYYENNQSKKILFTDKKLNKIYNSYKTELLKCQLEP